MNYPNLRILYVPGSDPILRVVDGLSRPSVEEKSFQTEEFPAKLLDPKIELPPPVAINNLDIVEISRSKLEDEQRSDPDLMPIFEELGKRSHANIGKKDYFLKNKTLMCQVTSGAVLTVVPASLARTLMEMLHIQTLHAGERRLMQAVNRSNFLFKGKSKREQEVDVPIRPSLHPWTRVSTDLMDISYGSTSCYLLTFICHFSRYADCEILTKKSADQMVPAMINLITRNGGELQMDISSDCGKEFINHALNAAYKNLKVFGHTQSPYNSRANPCERLHKELRVLLKTLQPNASDFKFKVKISVNFYNSLPQARLGGRSPREILTGCPPRRLLSHLHPEDENPSTENFSDVDESDLSKWESYLIALHNEHALKEINRFNSITTPKSTFKIDQLVMVLDPVINLSKSKSPRASGPYIIEKVSGHTLSLVHAVDHTRIMRNQRFVRKMCLPEETVKSLISHQKQTWRDRKIITPKSLTSADHLNIKIDEESPSSRYSLRKRE